MKDIFYKWLLDGHSKQYRPESIIANLETATSRLKVLKVASVSIWEITAPKDFVFVHRKAVKDKLFCIFTGHKGMKFFNECCGLYYTFLEDSKNSINVEENLSGNVVKENFLDVLKKIDDKCLIVKIKQKYADEVGLYQAVRHAWVLSEKRLGEIDYVLATINGIIKEVYTNLEWYKSEDRDRFAFNGIVAEDSIRKIYVGKIIPECYRKKGMASPTLYTFSPTENFREAGYIRLASRTTFKTAMNEPCQKRAKHIIASKFKSGYRTSSSIDFERFKNYYADEYGEEFTNDARGLEVLIQSVAVLFDDRAYIYDAETVETVRIYLEQMESPCIYIDVFFDKFADDLYIYGIFSVDMLKAFIEKNYADIFCKRDYIYLQPDALPFDLIRQVFNEKETWSFDELFGRLPCLKKDTIRAILNGSDYHRVETGVYTHVDNMDLPDSEGEKILDFVRDQLQSKDYITANELELTRFESLNPHCPFSAIRDAVFNKFLRDQYSKSGQVITRIGKKLRVLDILEQYCREAETASFEELNSFEATFDPGGNTHSACLIAAHNVMVRVSSDLFVTASKVSFDIDRTDEAIALYCRDNFIPLKNVVDFSLFPYAGYPWNLFLLESYLRKFSRQFKYDVRAVNSANIGVILRKSYSYGEYDDILAIALAKSVLSLNNKKAVGDYLFDNGYIGWRNLGKSEGKILADAKKLREEGAV